MWKIRQKSVFLSFSEVRGHLTSPVSLAYFVGAEQNSSGHSNVLPCFLKPSAMCHSPSSCKGHGARSAHRRNCNHSVMSLPWPQEITVASGQTAGRCKAWKHHISYSHVLGEVSHVILMHLSTVWILWDTVTKRWVVINTQQNAGLSKNSG